MTSEKKARVVLNGYGVIGKRLAEAITRQDDMILVGTRMSRRTGGCALRREMVSASMALR